MDAICYAFVHNKLEQKNKETTTIVQLQTKACEGKYFNDEHKQLLVLFMKNCHETICYYVFWMHSKNISLRCWNAETIKQKNHYIIPGIYI